MNRIFILIPVFFICNLLFRPDSNVDKINGVNFVAPVKMVGNECMLPLTKINANWVAITPYAYAGNNKPEIQFNSDWQWWGEKKEGARATIQYAKKHKLKIMLKPHVWVFKQGWAGDFILHDEDEWKIWEHSYEKYIIYYAYLAQSMGVEMLSIGTEYKRAVQKRPEFWKELIIKIKRIYHGKLTYAANWDNFQNITFWDQLDYIGIDAYFPLSDKNTPTVKELMLAWKPYLNSIRSFQTAIKKPVLFTEYGYRSIDKAAGKQWELAENHWDFTGPANFDVQYNAYYALYQTFWNEPWFAGGFIWKWYDNNTKAGGADNTDYTPQNKPVTGLIKKWYRKE
ncbi:MAG: hypothetical protein IIA88_05770 [Bacteroidetes bacterium]|nr:hypothetical protein [Bacteroidota bacterium]